MAFAGGVYTLPAGNPVTTNTTIESSWANTTLSDIASALSTCVLKDGTQTLTASLPMAGFKLTGLGAGTSANDSVRMAQLQNSTSQYLTGTTGTNTITASGSPTVTALAAGQTFRLIPANTNTGATTLQIDSTAATNVFWNGAAMVGGELRINVPVEVFYDGTQYQLIGSAAMANVYTTPDILRIQASGDRTKQLAFSVTGVSTATTRTVTMPDSNVTLPIINLNAVQTAGLALIGPVSGAAAIPAFRSLAGPDGASLVLLSTASASASATVDFASGFDATKYEEYILQGNDVVPATDGDSGAIRFSIDGGSNYRATAADYVWAMNGRVNTGSDVPYDSTTAGASTYMGITSSTGVSNTAANGGINFAATFKGFSSATQNKGFVFQAYYWTSAAASMFSLNGSGSSSSATLKGTAVSAVRFLFITGNTTSGTFRFYGVRKS